MVDLDNNTKKSTSFESNISDTGRTRRQNTVEVTFLVYKNLGQRVSESFEEDELENRRELQNIQEEAYSSDFESDEENEKDCRPKTIKDIRKSVLSFGSSKSTC